MEWNLKLFADFQKATADGVFFTSSIEVWGFWELQLQMGLGNFYRRWDGWETSSRCPLPFTADEFIALI
jgi:hypothetical protein